MKAEIYTTKTCSYCIKAKELLKEYKIPYVEKVVGIDTTKEELKELLKVPLEEKITVPQIWVDNRHVGGYTELSKLLEQDMTFYF